MLTKDQALDTITAGEVLCNIGQLDAATKRSLDRMVRHGEIAKWRGHWFPVSGASEGIGPLKTCYGIPSIAAWAQSPAANEAARREWNRITATDSLYRACRRAGVDVSRQPTGDDR